MKEKFTTEKERTAKIRTVEIQGTVKKNENGVFYLQDQNDKKYLFEIPPQDLKIDQISTLKIDSNFSKYGIELKSAYEKLDYFGVIYSESIMKIIESPEEIRIQELQAIFDNQYQNGLLDEETLNLVCEWIRQFAKVKIITIQAFGMIKNRPDQWNVENYQKYLQKIVSDLQIQYAKNKLPILIIITGPDGQSDPIGIAGREGVETALELEKMLKIAFNSETDSEDFLKDKILLLPVGSIMQKDGINYVRNLATAKDIVQQIRREIDLVLSINEFWTDSVRSWKHIACLICLGMDFTKARTAERIEVNENGKPSENQNWHTQTGSIGIVLALLLQRFLWTNLERLKKI